MGAEKCQNLLYIWPFKTVYPIYHIKTIIVIYLATLIPSQVDLCKGSMKWTKTLLIEPTGN